jgi:hypothetical protein
MSFTFSRVNGFWIEKIGSRDQKYEEKTENYDHYLTIF